METNACKETLLNTVSRLKWMADEADRNLWSVAGDLLACDVTVDEIAERVGVSRATAYRKLGPRAREERGEPWA